jgi:hypothetical protein
VHQHEIIILKIRSAKPDAWGCWVESQELNEKRVWCEVFTMLNIEVAVFGK